MLVATTMPCLATDTHNYMERMVAKGQVSSSTSML